MGDVIHTLPAATALRHAFPEATLGWVIEERWAELLCTLPTPRSGPRSPQRPLVDKIHIVNTKQWRSRLFHLQTWEQIGSAFSDLRAPKYEMAIDFQGAIRSALLARCSGTPLIYGFAQPRENAASMFYTRKVIARGTHIIEQNLSLTEAVLQRPLNVPDIQFPCHPAVENNCATNLEIPCGSNLVLLNPGAGWGAKQWPPERYGQVAKELAQEGFLCQLLRHLAIALGWPLFGAPAGTGIDQDKIAAARNLQIGGTIILDSRMARKLDVWYVQRPL